MADESVSSKMPVLFVGHGSLINDPFCIASEQRSGQVTYLPEGIEFVSVSMRMVLRREWNLNFLRCI